MTALPTVVRRESDTEELFVLALEPDDQVFHGHFPGNPILAGVTQVDWAIRCAVEAFGPLGDFQGFSNLKFVSLIQPPDTLELRLTHDGKAGRLSFRYDGVTGRKSSGVILFAVPG